MKWESVGDSSLFPELFPILIFIHTHVTFRRECHSTLLLPNNYFITMLSILHPVLSGAAASLATLVGQSFFSIPDYSVFTLARFLLGLALFAGLNHLLYKFKFNSYQLNGSTITTLVIFLTQNIVIGLSRIWLLSWKWWLGLTFITFGVFLIYQQHTPAQQSQSLKQQ